MATLDDIAHVVGVSKSTVSKALSGAGDVSGSMRKAVLEAAVELGYTRLPRGEKAPKLAVFVTNMEYKNPDDFGYDIIVGFRKLAEPDGFQVETIALTEELQRSVSYDEYMIRQNYRGRCFSASPSAPHGCGALPAAGPLPCFMITRLWAIPG